MSQMPKHQILVMSNMHLLSLPHSKELSMFALYIFINLRIETFIVIKWTVTNMASSMQQQEMSNETHSNNIIVVANVTPSNTPSHNVVWLMCITFILGWEMLSTHLLTHTFPTKLIWDPHDLVGPMWNLTNQRECVLKNVC